jgi:hypothetical protein
MEHSILAYVGTTSQIDIDSDINGIGLNKLDHPEFQKAYDVSDIVRSKYGDNVLYSGHTLGF